MLLAHARTDANNRNGPAVHADLGEFVSDVKTLTTSGQISRAAAGKLDRQARATAAQAVEQLRPKPTSTATTATAVTQTTVPSTAMPSTTTPPTAGHPPPHAEHTTPPATGHPSPPAQHAPPPPKQHDQGPGGDRPDPAMPGPGHEHGHGDGGGYSSQDGVHQTGSDQTWAQWWNHVTGAGGD